MKKFNSVSFMNNINPIYSINNSYLPAFKQKEVSNNAVTNPINGNTKTRTSWIYEKNSNNLERICRWELSDSGRKCFDFYPDVTETMSLRYLN